MEETLKRQKDSPKVLEETTENPKYKVFDEATNEYKDIDINAILQAYEDKKALEEKTKESSARTEIEQEKAKQLEFLRAMQVAHEPINTYLPEEDQQGDDNLGYEPIEVPQQENELPALQSIFQSLPTE